MCIDMVRQKVDAVAGDVVTAMLQLSRPHETRLQEDRSAPLAESAISAAVADIIESGRSIQLSPDRVSGASAAPPSPRPPLSAAAAEVLRRLAADTSEVRARAPGSRPAGHA